MASKGAGPGGPMPADDVTTDAPQTRPYVAALVPAKLASRRLPRKNVAELGGAPLFVHAVRTANAVRGVAGVFVSTEADEVAALARGERCRVIRRPAALAGPRVTNLAVMRHAASEIARLAGAAPELIVLLQPTHPFRDPAEIGRAIAAMLADPDASSLVSVAPVGRAVGTVRDGRWEPPEALATGATKARPASVANRGAFYVFRRRLTIDRDVFFGERILAHELEKPDLDVDIDTAWDLEVARLALQRHPGIAAYVAPAAGPPPEGPAPPPPNPKNEDPAP